jgi:penicillin amidase
MLRFLLVLATTCPVLAQDAPPTVDPTVRTSGAFSSDVVEDEVAVAYDGFGVPTVVAKSRGDAYFAQGFLHGQNRFAQMDVTRRVAAGEIAAMAGAGGLGQDRDMRRFRLRTVARAVTADLDPETRAVVERYADGVNAGVGDLAAPPPEYAILRITPVPWTAEDTILVMLAFSVMLEDSAAFEVKNAAMFESLPPEVRDYLMNPLSRFDAPIPGFESRAPSIPRIPARDQISLRDLPEPPPTIQYDYGAGDDDDGPGSGAPGGAPDGGRLESEQVNPGSNNWGVSGRMTRDGRAILASDPHLQLLLPGSWYRIRLQWPDHDLVGLSIPGIPGITMGSNGHVAWGFTNLTGDFQDIITIEVDPDDPGRYRTPDGWEPFGEIIETIEVSGGESIELPLKTTRWGVVNAEYRDKSGVMHPGVIEWAALNPELINIDVLGIEDATSIDDALDTFANWKGPAQNAVVVDSQGRVGYTVSGFLPNRGRIDGRAPYSLADGTERWVDREQGSRPRLTGEDVDFVFSANNRTVDVGSARKLGYAWANPARARRIRDVLSSMTEADEAAMLALQMDSTTLGLDPWRRLVLDVIAEGEPDEQLAAARTAILEWNGRADVDQVGVTLLDDVRMSALEELSSAVATWAEEQGLGVFDEAYLHEEPYLRVIEDQADNWLPPGDADSWQLWLRGHVRDAVARGSIRPWGDSNRITLASPFAGIAPAPMRSMLEIECGPQSGYWNAPKVLMPGFGASARLVVSPSHEEDGYLLTPGGQSGNPLSPHYRSLNDSWLAGDPLPLLPGEMVASFSLVPGSDEGAAAN